MGAPKRNQYAKGNKGGRPPKVKPQNLPAFGEELVAWAAGKYQTLLSEPDKEAKMPFFIKTFCREHKISDDTLQAYRGANKEFSVSYKQARQIIAEALMVGALKGWWHPTAFIFIAKNETEMRDNSSVDLTSGGEKITVNLVEFKR
jgi:hypothetical protein